MEGSRIRDKENFSLSTQSDKQEERPVHHNGFGLGNRLANEGARQGDQTTKRGAREREKN